MNITRKQVFVVQFKGSPPNAEFACSSFNQAIQAAEEKFPKRTVDGVSKAWQNTIYVVTK